MLSSGRGESKNPIAYNLERLTIFLQVPSVDASEMW